MDFVLDKDQVAELAAYLRLAFGGLREPLGRKQAPTGVRALTPKVRLQNLLQDAATNAHPGWHDIGDNTYEADVGTPGGARLVAWFKRTYPRKAARIEQEFTKQLWRGEI
jgi:hypothetical protein